MILRRMCAKTKKYESHIGRARGFVAHAYSCKHENEEVLMTGKEYHEQNGWCIFII